MVGYSLHDGELLVKAARNAIELHISSPNFSDDVVQHTIGQYSEKRGVYVVLEHYPTMSLRGMIGFPRPIDSLSTLVVDAAVGAASGNDKFVPISHYELNELVVQVNILSEMEKLKKTEASRKKDIKIGRDGLFVSYGFKSGIILPHIPTQKKWNKEDLLRAVCMDAGLAHDAWKRHDVELSKFTSQAFREAEPEGEVIELHGS